MSKTRKAKETDSLPTAEEPALTARSIGQATNYSVAGSSTTSFTASSTTLQGGLNAGGFYAPYITFYSYDALGNLTQVNQLGDGSQPARVRSFTYDSLGRLLTAQNPESGKIIYQYDADGNLLMKTSPAPNQPPGSTLTQSVSYCYDELHRVTKKDYQAHTFSPPACPITAPVVSYTYDAGTNGKGHLTSLADQAGTGAYSFDPLGRISSETRVISGQSKTMSYDYNLDGSIKADALSPPSMQAGSSTSGTPLTGPAAPHISSGLRASTCAQI